MHDITDLERRGIPSIFVASAAFIEAAEAQAKALGFEPAAHFVPHPIQDRTDAEMQILARDALPSILALVTAQ